MKDLISLSSSKARSFFMEGNNYCNIDMPKYFKPDPLLKKISLILSGSKVSNFFLIDSRTRKNTKPNDCENVNYKLYGNKDGELAWRRFELIHPVLYVDLVNLITFKNNWKILCDRFIEFKNTVVTCASIPIVRSNKKSHKAEQVLKWWEDIEQEALKLGLEYNYVYSADIADCYGSIYTHFISHALHGKVQAREDKNAARLLGSQIDRCLQSMQYRQTNGIPQGSVVSDFIAEIVLGYSDELLSDKIKNIDRNEYKILRYRDDYKIFTNRPDIGKEILKALSLTLADLGMRLNSDKTRESFDPIIAAVKADKIDELFLPTKHENYSKWLMQIYATINKHPNSGKVARQLNLFHEALSRRQKKKDKLKKYENPTVMISIITNIAIKNPKHYNWCAAIISILLEYCAKKDRKNVSDKVVKRFKNVPNVGLLDIWLQRVTFVNYPDKIYEENICKLVRLNDYPGNENIWESQWLTENLRKTVNETRIIDKKELKKLKPVVGRDETDLFRNIHDS